MKQTCPEKQKPGPQAPERSWSSAYWLPIPGPSEAQQLYSNFLETSLCSLIKLLFLLKLVRVGVCRLQHSTLNNTALHGIFKNLDSIN